MASSGRGHHRVLNLEEVLSLASEGGYAVGSFSPRYTPMIKPVLDAGQIRRSPLIVQISQKELLRYRIEPDEFAAQFFAEMSIGHIDIPVTLHLDHSRDWSVIEGAIRAGFTSVMIDASEHRLDENIRLTREVVHLASTRGVSVEAELGRIGTTDFIETDTDEQLYTIPSEAARFVAETRVQALAVSVGTAHGLYTDRQPNIDFDRLAEIWTHVKIPLVLHGGSGIAPSHIKRAIAAGVAKVNIATDLETAMLGALGLSARMTNAECLGLGDESLETARRAVQSVVEVKMKEYLDSADKVKFDSQDLGVFF